MSRAPDDQLVRIVCCTLWHRVRDVPGKLRLVCVLAAFGAVFPTSRPCMDIGVLIPLP